MSRYTCLRDKVQTGTLIWRTISWLRELLCWSIHERKLEKIINSLTSIRNITVCRPCSPYTLKTRAPCSLTALTKNKQFLQVTWRSNFTNTFTMMAFSKAISKNARKNSSNSSNASIRKCHKRLVTRCKMKEKAESTQTQSVASSRYQLKTAPKIELTSFCCFGV